MPRATGAVARDLGGANEGTCRRGGKDALMALLVAYLLDFVTNIIPFFMPPSW